MHEFCIERDGIAEGPYSAQEILSMNLPLETMVLDSESGKWHPLSEYNMEVYNFLENNHAVDNPSYSYPRYNDSTTGYVQEDAGTLEYVNEDDSTAGYEQGENTIQQPEEATADEGMSDEEFQAWREKKREEYAKERSGDSSADGVANMVGGVVTAGIGALITALSGGSVIKIGLLVFGAYLFLKGFVQLISGKSSNDDKQSK